jgi:hypothetical protein
MTPLADTLRAALLAAARPDGGCGYYRGQSSRLEPTAWAMLALDRDAPDAVRTLLPSWQRASGHLVDPGSPEPNFAWDALGLLALETTTAPRDRTAALVTAMVAAKGIKLDNGGAIKQDQQIQAWSWIDKTFSWAEPTAWSLIALKRIPDYSADLRARIDDGERMLFDRVCHPGGWNYGNSNAFTQDLRPYVPTTALGLLALANRADRDEVRRSLAWLEANALTERSAMALSLTAIALHVHARPTTAVLAALVDQHARTAFLDNAHLTAMALYALTLDRHDAAAFRVTPAPAKKGGRE